MNRGRRRDFAFALVEDEVRSAHSAREIIASGNLPPLTSFRKSNAGAPAMLARDEEAKP